MKPKTKKSKKPEISQKTRLERIMFEENIKVNQLHEGTGIAYPTLFNMIKGRKTTFRKRTIRDMETYLKRPAEQFLGFEGEKIKTKIKN